MSGRKHGAVGPGRWDLVIFDCDGVLVDTEPLHCRVFAAQVTAIGLPMTAAEIDREFRGLSGAASMAIVQERLGRPIPEGFQIELERLVAVAYETELRLVPGVAEAVAQIPFRLCVASSGRLERVQQIVDLMGLSQYFEDRIFSAYQVERGKPFPDLFVHVAQSLGVEPARCAVIEDSLFGVQAGVAAGMRVFGYEEGGETRSLSEAGAVVFSDMAELPGLLLG